MNERGRGRGSKRGRYRPNGATAAMDPRPQRPRKKRAEDQKRRLSWGEGRVDERPEGGPPGDVRIQETRGQNRWRKFLGLPPLRSGYLRIVGENPETMPGLSAAGMETAQLKLARVEEAINRGGWTKPEWRRLHQMRKKWRMRVEGRDWRWMVVGNKRKGGWTANERTGMVLGKLLAIVRKEEERARERSEA